MVLIRRGTAQPVEVFDASGFIRNRRFTKSAIIPFQISSGLSLVPTEYKLTVSFVILVIVLLARPTGIFKGASS